MLHHSDDAEHVARCDDCQVRASLDAASLDVDLEGAWIGVAAEAYSSPVGWTERTAERLLGSPGLARALVNTPSLFLSWVLASTAVLLVGVLASPLSGDPWVGLLAPALAGAGVAFAYGPGVDPAFELSQTTVVSSRTVLLARVLTVFGLNAALGLAASLFTAAAVGVTMLWLVPMTTVSALALAAATLTRSTNAGVLVALSAWGLTVLAAGSAGNPTAAATSAALTPFYTAATAALVALVLYANKGKGELTWR